MTTKCGSNFKEIGGRCVRRVKRAYHKKDEPDYLFIFLIMLNVVLVGALIWRFAF